MNSNDFDRFAEMLNSVGEMYGKQVSSTMMGMYFKALEEYDIRDLQRAFNLHVRNPDNGMFFPKPADLVRMMGGDTGTQSGIAWSKVIETVRRVGAYSSVAFDDSIIHRVVTDMGGWPKLCEMKEAETPFVAKDFERRYQGYAMRRAGLDAGHEPILIGITDALNSKYGITPQPVLVGNSQAALATIRLGKEGAGRLSITLGDAADANERGRIRQTDEEQGRGRRAIPAICVDESAAAVGRAGNPFDLEPF